VRAKTYLSLLALASIFLGTIAAAMPVKAAPGPVTIEIQRDAYVPYIPGVAVGGWVWISVDIGSPYSWDLTSSGIVGWTFDVHVDRDVLQVWGAYGATFDYFLYDFIDWNMLGAEHYPSLLVGEVNDTTGDMRDIAEFIMGYEALGQGAGGNSYPEDWWYGSVYGLVRLRLRSRSATAYTKIDISDAAYYTVDGTKHTIPDADITDGHYNAPPVPEFPLGAAVEVGLIVAVAYIWWTRRRKLKEVPYR
jgi:hypothetical protein